MGVRRLSRFHVACSDGGAVAAAREMIYNACQQTQGSIFGEGLKERLSRWFVPALTIVLIADSREPTYNVYQPN